MEHDVVSELEIASHPKTVAKICVTSVASSWLYSHPYPCKFSIYSWLGGSFKYLYVHSYLGRWSNLTCAYFFKLGGEKPPTSCGSKDYRLLAHGCWDVHRYGWWWHTRYCGHWTWHARRLRWLSEVRSCSISESRIGNPIPSLKLT